MLLSVPDMSCQHCKAAVEAAIARIDPAAQVTVDLAARRVTVTGTATPAALIAALDAVGFPAAPV
ncbi:MAG: heavy-metal-associated domain-containing protein [Gemmobacter sp.]